MLRKLGILFLLSVWMALPIGNGVRADANAPGFVYVASHATTTVETFTVIDSHYQAFYFIVRITALGTAQTLRLRVIAADIASAAYGQMTLDSTASGIMESTGTYVFSLGPPGTAGTGVDENLTVMVPGRWMVQSILGNSESLTFSIEVIPYGGW